MTTTLTAAWFALLALIFWPRRDVRETRWGREAAHTQNDTHQDHTSHGRN